MNAARALDSRGYGFRELIFHVVVVLLNRVHAVVLVKRFQKEMREVAILKRRSFVGKLFLLSGVRIAGPTPWRMRSSTAQEGAKSARPELASLPTLGF